MITRNCLLSLLVFLIAALSPAPAAATEVTLFEELPPEKTGVAFVPRLDADNLDAYLYHSGYACGGVCVGDVTGDGKPDIFLVSGPDDNALFVNKGGFVFEKSAATVGDDGKWGVGASMADADGDGDLDIFLANYDSANRLWLNDGTGQFAEAGSKAGLDFIGPSQAPYFADFDGDGDLDLFLLTNRLYYPFGRPHGAASELGPDQRIRVKDEFAKYFTIITPPGGASSWEPPAQPSAGPVITKLKPFLLEYGHEDRLYRNNGPGADGVPQFKDVTAESGFAGSHGHGLSALIWDVNGDGRPDIYVANDYTDPDRLWINDGGLRFREALDEYLPMTTWSSMGSDIADVNGDGRLDFMVADMAGTTHFKAKTTMGEMNGYRRWVLESVWPRQAMRNMLFINSGAGRFMEAAFMAGVARSDWTWAVKFADFDMDGRTDLYLTNGTARTFADSDKIVKPSMIVGRPEWEIFRNEPEQREKHLAFRNEGGLQFTDVSAAWGLDRESMAYGAATGDLDGDGALDLVVCHLNENVSLYRNRAAAADANHWLKVKLEGLKNRFGMGAIVTASLADNSRIVRLMNPQTGFLSCNEPVLHFGLGKAASVTSLEVQWPSGAVQTLKNQKANQTLVVKEMANAKPAPPAVKEATLFVEVTKKTGLSFKHEDQPYDDYRKEFLLPGKLSQFGPCLAVADVNGDGLDDVYAGGAAGQTGVLFVHQADHFFLPLEDPPWAAHSASEDMGALFVDADRDGDLDLYIASGSNEWPAGDALYADHLYLNASAKGGPVNFSEAPPGALPDVRQSGSCACGADFDRDGDVDLFIGARSVPGEYPVTPDSVLLRNDGTKPGEVKFSDATDAVAKELRKCGLVTSAIWSDADGDRWIDLLVACEWGPVRLFLNDKGKLIERTEEAGLATRTGWWNAVTAADIDADGDMDYVILNAGSNTKYGNTTEQKPAVLYRGDMDGTGTAQLVEAKCMADGELPVRGRSCSSTAMPFIKGKFKTYKSFAAANLSGIYTDDKLKSSLRVAATELESGVLINGSTAGAPKFAWQPLPAPAQISPGYGIVAADFFGDGRPALAIAQNLFTREPETGLWRGGLGCFLRPGKSSPGAFFSEEHARTGFVVPGDAKALALLDLDGNSRPDLLAAQNNDRLLAFRNTATTGKPLRIRLAGPPGNPGALGASVRLLAAGKIIASAEVAGGSGCLTQSSASLFFHHLQQPRLSISVRWPDGRQSSAPVPRDAPGMDLRWEQDESPR